MIYYKNFKWQQQNIVTDSLPTPKNCAYCGGSALLDAKNGWRYNAVVIRCQKKKYKECRYYQFTGQNIKITIELWNNQVELLLTNK